MQMDTMSIALDHKVNLAVGDTIWFQRRSGLSYGFGNTHYTYFTGWLIG
jgi:hypothetical protein